MVELLGVLLGYVGRPVSAWCPSTAAVCCSLKGDGSWEEPEGDVPSLPGGDKGNAGAGSCEDIHQSAQLAAGVVSEGNSFLSLLTWVGVELLTWR